MPKKGNPTHSDSNLKEPKPVPRIKLFKEDRHTLFEILREADKPVSNGKSNLCTSEYKNGLFLLFIWLSLRSISGIQG